MKYNGLSGHGKNVPPDREHVAIYFQQKGMAVEIEKFCNFYESIGWANKSGRLFRNWKTLACDWIWNCRHAVNVNLIR